MVGGRDAQRQGWAVSARAVRQGEYWLAENKSRFGFGSLDRQRKRAVRRTRQRSARRWTNRVLRLCESEGKGRKWGRQSNYDVQNDNLPNRGDRGPIARGGGISHGCNASLDPRMIAEGGRGVSWFETRPKAHIEAISICESARSREGFRAITLEARVSHGCYAFLVGNGNGEPT